jgi:hypothetical protein
VSFARIAKENRFDTHVLKRNEKLFRFRNRNIAVVLAMDD